MSVCIFIAVHTHSLNSTQRYSLSPPSPPPIGPPRVVLSFGKRRVAAEMRVGGRDHLDQSSQ